MLPLNEFGSNIRLNSVTAIMLNLNNLKLKFDTVIADSAVKLCLKFPNNGMMNTRDIQVTNYT